MGGSNRRGGLNGWQGRSGDRRGGGHRDRDVVHKGFALCSDCTDINSWHGHG